MKKDILHIGSDCVKLLFGNHHEVTMHMDVKGSICHLVALSVKKIPTGYSHLVSFAI